MRRNALVLVLVLLVLAGSLALAGCGSNSDPAAEDNQPLEVAGTSGECSTPVPDPEPEDLAALAGITADEAVAAALAAYPGHTMVEVELENENGCLIYSVDLSDDLEVMVDAGNGTILGTETEHDHDDVNGDQNDNDDGDDNDTEQEGEHEGEF
jgi:ABC-type glycerol-3-phosphate transport system substrate-binding protein